MVTLVELASGAWVCSPRSRSWVTAGLERFTAQRGVRDRRTREGGDVGK